MPAANKPFCSSKDAAANGLSTAFSTSSTGLPAATTATSSRAPSLLQPLAVTADSASRASGLQQPVDRRVSAAGVTGSAVTSILASNVPSSNAASPDLTQAQKGQEQVQTAAVQQPPLRLLKQPQRAAKAATVPTAPEASAAQALQQHLQQYRSSMQAENALHLKTGSLPLPYAACCLSQPGSQFLPGFQATVLDDSTTLPGLTNSKVTDAAVTAASQLHTDMWQHTTWNQPHALVATSGASVHPSGSPAGPRGSLQVQHEGRLDVVGPVFGSHSSQGGERGGQDGSHCFSLEAIHSLGVALGTPGLQLSVLTLSFIDLGDAAVKNLCKGLIK